MEYSTSLLLLAFLFTFIYVFAISGSRNSRLPPGPYPLPIIGNLLKLNDKPHRALAALSKHYGPLMSLKLGSRTTIVVSSPDIAKEFFQTNDLAFSSRSIPHAAEWSYERNYSIAWLPVGDEWRRLRKITKEYLFSKQCLDDTEQLRMKKVQELIDHVSRCCRTGEAVNIGTSAFTATLNILSNLTFSQDFSRYDSTSSQEIKDTIWNMMEIGGKSNIADFFPALKPLDPQGLARRAKRNFKRLQSHFDTIIDQRLQIRRSLSSYDSLSSPKNDILDLLLNLNLKQDESEFSLSDIKTLFTDFFAAGTETTSTTIEWAMAELIHNPKKMEIARLELGNFLPNNRNFVHEHDIPQLPYLQAIVKETLRLHPPVPFLIPHEAIHDVEVKDFIVPKNAQILCNVWAIGRDQNIWSDPETFMPERFLEVELDYKGNDFELIPFGSGRRICPGLNVAYRMLHVILGSLIHNFDWKLEGYMKPQDMDMSEKFGLTLPKHVPLMVVPIKL